MNPLAFRYKPFYLAAAFACSFVPVVVSVFICLVASPKPSVRAVLFLLSCGAAGTALFAYGYRYLKSFRITVQDAGVTVTALHRRRFIPFDSVGKVIYLRTSRPVIICLYDVRGKRLEDFSDAIDGLDELASEILRACITHGTAFEVRSKRR